jgi:hypothetical protein
MVVGVASRLNFALATLVALGVRCPAKPLALLVAPLAS